MRNTGHFDIQLHPAVNVNNLDFICGVEHEVEHFDMHATNLSPLSQVLEFHIDDDFSLINGKELITKPAGIRQQIAFHEALHMMSNWYGDRFSDRTSTHVHVNVSGLTEQQTLALLKMYCLLEPRFFAFIGPEREHNINCVPLWATQMVHHVFNMDYGYLPSKWHKYTALNLIPMGKIGTIEFRHLYGTQDTKTFANWLGLIKALYDWAVEDEGRFNSTLPELLKGGYNACSEYLETLQCPLGRFVTMLTPYTNSERSYDVYLLLLTEVFGGLSNWKKFIKDFN